MPQSPLTVEPLKVLQWHSIGIFSDWIHGIEQASGQKCHYRKCGRVEIITSLKQRKRFERQVAARSIWSQHSLSGRLQLISRKEAQAIVRDVGDSEYGYLFCEDTAQVSIAELIKALAGCIRENGGNIIEGCTVQGVQSRPDSVVVTCDGTVKHCQKAILAAGAWTSSLKACGFLIPSVMPVKGQVAQLARTNEDIDADLPIVKRDKAYIVDHLRRGWLVGSTTEHDSGFDETPTAEGLEILTKGAEATRVSMRGRRIVEHWAGLRPLCKDRRPAIGCLSSNVLMASGHFKIGVGTAPITAMILRDLIENNSGDELTQSFNPLRAELAISP